MIFIIKKMIWEMTQKHCEEKELRLVKKIKRNREKRDESNLKFISTQNQYADQVEQIHTYEKKLDNYKEHDNKKDK